MGEINKIHGYEIREPYESENKYFKQNPSVSGMATKDNRIILNPFSNLNPTQKGAVLKNEAVRLFLRESNINPMFDITDSQKKMFKGTPYENDEMAMKHSIIGRILSGDRSASGLTKDQIRIDGTLKGEGYFGKLPTKNRKGYSTELSIGVHFDGKERLIPSLVPTLTEEEKDYLLGGGKTTKSIMDKAVEHARMRIGEGKSPFADNGKYPVIPSEQIDWAKTVHKALERR